MIPKIIHYCWFGKGKKNELTKRCIESWKKYCPDFEIIEWNEDNFDLKCMPFAEEAYGAKKYAFVSDVARLLILYEHGGIYFDTDVEVVREIASLLDCNGFIGFENKEFVATGLGFGAEKGSEIVGEMLDTYRSLCFLNHDGSLNMIGCPNINTDIMVKAGMVRNGERQSVGSFEIYPPDYFNPMDNATGILNKTENTYSIHWYSMTWLPKSIRFRSKVTRIFHRVFGVDCFKSFKKHGDHI